MMKINGFTLIELLVASAIIIVITGFGLAGWTRFREKALVRTTADELKTELRLVRSWAINGRKPIDSCSVLNGYQVKENGGNLDIFVCCGGSCDFRVKTISIDESLEREFSPSSFQITFFSLTGTAEIVDGSEATITLRYHDQEQTITISRSGEIE